MRILASGDLHGDMGLASRLAEKSEKEKIDLVILCGDLTFREQSTKNIIGPFVKKKKKVLIIPGNHETIATTDFLAELYGVKNIHGYSVKYEHIGIFGCGGANIGPHSKFTDKEIYDLLKQGFESIQHLSKKIMVTHVHPTGTRMEKLSEFVPGSSGVRRAIEKFKPDILFCSHVHEAEGIEEIIGSTQIMNVGRHGKIIEL